MSRSARLAALLILAGAVRGATLSPDELLAEADRPRGRFREAVITTRVTVLENGREGSPSGFDVYRKGDDRCLIVFTEGNQKGRKILTVGEKFWLLLPGASRPLPVTANQRLIGGASFGDIARMSLASAFTAVRREKSETVGGRACTVLDLTARSPVSPYGSGALWMDEADHLPRQARFNLASGKPSKEVEYTGYERVGGEWELRQMVIRDLLSPNHPVESRIDYVRIRRANLPDELFTPERALRF